MSPRTLSRFLLVLACTWATALSTATPVNASGSQRFVATNGSDGAAGTFGHPWRTVQHGLASLRAGDHLYVRGGVYIERIKSVNLRQGTATDPILVSNYPGERATVKG